MSTATAAPTTEPELNQLNEIRYFGLVLAGLVGGAILFCAVWVYWNRQLRVIKVHQPLFLITICVGLFLGAMAVVPLSLDDEVLSKRGCGRACMANQWLVTLCYNISFASLFAKLNRINQVFHTARFQRVKVEAKDVMKPFLVLFTINFSLLLAWTLVDPWRWERKPIADDEWDTYGACSIDDAGNVFLASLFVVNFISLILVCWQAWKARDISVEFNETKYLAIGIYNWVQLQVVATPTRFVIGNENPSASYLLEASILLMICFSMLLLLFVPIFLQVRKYRRHRQRESNTMIPSTLPLSERVHVTGLPASASTTPRETAISGMTNTTNGGHVRLSDSTEVTALKNRVATLEEDVNDLKQRDAELERRNKELENLIRLDEEKGKKHELSPETNGTG